MKNKSLFIVWGTPDQGPRSKALAKKLGIEINFIHTGLPRGALTALIRYPIQAVRTMWLLIQTRPRVIFIQSPPPLAVVCAYVYCAFTKAIYIVDAHSTAFSNRRWVAAPLWVRKVISRGAVFTIVTNDHWKELIHSWGGQAIIIRDIPTDFPRNGDYSLSTKFNIAFINTFAEDEPLGNFLEAARELPDYQFYVTGKIRTKDTPVLSNTPLNVNFTNFLPDESYYALLRSVDAIMCLTTRDHTMQRGACEALSLGKPIITSNWTLLREYFHKGTVHVDNSPAGIRLGVEQMKEHHNKYKLEIKELQSNQQAEWQENVRPLTELIRECSTLQTGSG